MRFRKIGSRSLALALIATLSLALAGCDDNGAAVPANPTATPSPTAKATSTATGVPATATRTETVRPPETTTPVRTATPAEIATETPLPATATETPVPSTTATETDTPSPSATATASATGVPATATPTETPVPVAEQLAATGVGKYLGITPAAMSVNGDWEEYTYDPADGKAICLRGTPYQVNLRRGNVNKVLLYLEGGGACWDYATCWQQQLAKLTAGPAAGVGILEANNVNNPFDGWNVIYASYCDGSVYAGDNVADYDGNQTYHHGVQNLSAAVSLMLEEFPDPNVIVVSGSSAGGFGTFTGYAVTRVAYPDTPLLVLDDSGPGLQNPDDTQPIQDRIDNWKFTQYVPTSCAQCGEQLTYLTDWALDRDPDLRAAYFNYLQDSVLRFFFNISATDFEALLRSVSGEVQQRHPDRLKRFLKTGESHTILELPGFYTLKIGDISMRDWTADFLTDGPNWQDLVE